MRRVRRVVITGIGGITPLGVGIRRTWKRLINGECGIVSIKDRHPGFAPLPCTVAGTVPNGSLVDGGWNALDHLSRIDVHKMAKFAQYSVVAAAEALRDAEWMPSTDSDKNCTGVCVGSGIGNLEDIYDTVIAFDKNGYKKVAPLFVPRLLINLAAGHIAMRFGLRGPNHAVTTACTTGAHSIGDASRFIAFGDADVMVAGGAESCIHPLAIAGFARSRSLATEFNDKPALASRPFDSARCGFVMGEGAAVLVLEELEHAKARGARIYAELEGYGSSADAYHMTAPLEGGSGALAAMKHALRQAKCRPREVDYINAHATSTPIGDAAENKAIKTLLLGEDGYPNSSQINVSSTKGATGHLLGASGAIEAAFAILAIYHDIIPPTLNVEHLTEEFDCNYVPNVAQEKIVNVALSNSFGFGGTNACLCFRKYQ